MLKLLTIKYGKRKIGFARFYFLVAVLLWSFTSLSQSAYYDSVQAFQENYRNTLEVIKSDERNFISFYPVNEHYNVLANVELVKDEKGFDMETSSGMKKHFFTYAKLLFELDGNPYRLFIYRSKALMTDEKYKDYLFIPFGDATSGVESYGGGRYIDAFLSDIKDGKLQLDFNKAYNPYCAYAAGYNCPLPPRENLLSIAIPAGEKNYGKPYH